MLRFFTKNLARDLRLRLSCLKVSRALAALPKARFVAPPPAASGKVQVAALQVQAKAHPSLQAFVAQVDKLVGTAVQGGAQLVCFPEMFGLLLAGVSPLVRGGLQLLGLFGKNDEGEANKPAARPKAAAKQPALFLPQAFAPLGFLADVYIAIMRQMAKRYRVHIACGTYYACQAGKLYNRQDLYTPTGKIAGRQDKLHLVQEEAAMGISAGSDICVANTAIGRIALMVCMDASYFETFKVAKNLGADFAIVPIGDLAKFDEYLALRGAQCRVSETGLPAVKAALVAGQGFPLGFSGRAGVYFPMDCGFASVESSCSGSQEIVMAKLNLPALRGWQSQEFCRPNPAFNQKYFAALVEACGV